MLFAAIAAVAVLIVSARVGGVDARPLPPGLATGGQLTATLLPLAKLAHIAAAVGVAGTLITALLVRSGPRMDVAGDAVLARVRPWAIAWAAAALGTALLSISDIAAIDVVDVVTSDALLDYLWTIKQARALMVTALCALLVAALAALATSSRWGPLALLVVAGVGAGAPTLTGHAATAANHYVAIGSLLVHVLAVTTWVGGLLGLIIYVRALPSALSLAVRRFSTVALWCYVIVAASGVVNAATRLDPVDEVFTSSYGWLVLGKGLAVLVLGAIGWLHRSRTIPAVIQRRPRAFARLAGAEILVMAGTLGLAVALSQTPTP